MHSAVNSVTLHAHSSFHVPLCILSIPSFTTELYVQSEKKTTHRDLLSSIRNDRHLLRLPYSKPGHPSHSTHPIKRAEVEEGRILLGHRLEEILSEHSPEDG